MALLSVENELVRLKQELIRINMGRVSLEKTLLRLKQGEIRIKWKMLV
jgi:hypothetical protein